MTSQRLVPCIWFDDDAEAAVELYTSAIGGRITAVARYPEGTSTPSNAPPGSVLTIDFELAEYRFTALNGGPRFRPNPTLSFYIEVETTDEVDRLYSTLSDGGTTLMGLDEYPWSKRYAWIEDRFGVSWQIGVDDEPGIRIVPTLLFAGEQFGRGEEALELYARVFDEGRVEEVQLYGPEGPEGKLLYGTALLVGSRLAAMDTGVPMDISFTEGVSLQVMCRDQAEVDRYWDALTADGGVESRCGWLRDRFGVSWQIVPEAMIKYLSGDDHAAMGRAFAAMMPMRKLDLATLERAYRGEVE